MTDSRLKLNLHQRQLQTLTPLQIQFVKVLEMSAPEVEAEVAQTLDENPALEVAEEHTDDHADFNESAEEIQRADYSNDDDMPESYATHRDGVRQFEPVVVQRGDTLYEFILRQLREAGVEGRCLEAAKYIAGNIDDNGYLTRSLQAIADDIAIATGHDWSDADLDEPWRIIRSLDPAGIGAVDLRDCLLLQLDHRCADNPDDVAAADARRIVADHFDIFSRMHFDRLRSIVDLSDEAFSAAVRIIRSLNPKPGSIVSGDSADDRMRQITPDFVVDHDTDTGRLTLSMPNNIPRLQLERSFAPQAPIATGRGAAEANLFIRRKRDDAVNFIRALEMRQSTLMNVMSAILDFQLAFFNSEDVKDLRPMILKDVASATGYDQSVVSRSTAGKYVATPHGIYPLKFFFSERPNDKVDASAHEILDAIRSIVADEDKRSPLSDEAIATTLAASGYEIARRTVAKYRERLGIPVARLRRNM